MPHKHTRRPLRDEDKLHDLDPSVRATALSTGKQNGSSVPAKKRKRTDLDDTPKALARILNFHKNSRKLNGLDDGLRPRKKQKAIQTKSVKDAEGIDARRSAGTLQSLKLLPGEKLSDFSARVNQSMPIAGLSQKGRKIEGIKERQTRLQKKITKKQDAWRREEARRQEKAADARDTEEQDLDQVNYWGPTGVHRSKRKRRQGDMGILADEDPWEQLKAKRERTKGLHDVAQAPPEFKKPPSVKLKDKTRGPVDNHITTGETRRGPFRVDRKAMHVRDIAVS